VVSLDGSEGLSVQYAPCCKPIPGDRIVGYLGRGEGLTVHAEDCPTGRRLLMRDSERFLQVEWADEPVRPFETMVVVTVTNGKGVLARVASAIAAAEADITHVDMGDEPAQTATDIRFSVSVRDRQHLADVLRSLKRTTSVLKAQRFKPAKP
jgi:GTP pyrophosphokinase